MAEALSRWKPMWKPIMRWVLVLPGATLGSFLAELFFGLLFVFNHGLPELGERRPLYVDIEMAVAGPIAFTYAAARLSPNRKAISTLAFALLYSISGAVIIYFEIFRWSSQWWVVALRDLPRLITPLIVWACLRQSGKFEEDRESPIVSQKPPPRLSNTFLADYRVRLRAIGSRSYFKTLLCWDLAGLILTSFVVLAFFVLSWSAEVQIEKWAKLWWLPAALLFGRAIFHRRIGLLASEVHAFNGAAMLIILGSFTLWAGSGFRPVGEDGWREILGLVGILISYLIPMPLYIIAISIAMFFPSMFLRGFDYEESKSIPSGQAMRSQTSAKTSSSPSPQADG